VTVRASWRIVFRFQGNDAFDRSADRLPLEREKKNMPMKNPAHPGLIVRHDCLEPLKLSVTAAAKILGVTRQALNLSTTW
jgi:hypothetical protein